LAAQCGHYRHIRPIILGHRANNPRSLRSPAVPPGHREIDARLIDELEALGGESGGLLLIGCPCLLDALGASFAGVERLFLRGNLRVMTRRPMVGTLTRKPCWAKSRSHNSASVASGCS
jgi:hypothetical protein